METTDFKLEPDKIFLKKFCQQEPKFKEKIQSILEAAFCECVSLRSPCNRQGLTLIWEGFLAVRFEVGWGELLALPKPR